ncbi:hypothetical protein [Agrobacterium larrymoorei]|uniref:Uncharacterized protein n=1 Tax=Agrobacterium larrymoorei TaxID=160699 RepID=A0ABU0ULQ9_9HYPH|nr:hypothetical protein [Agrobacterium larrymoorei]MDQ1185897.1 hypothetical protein [Agrobacterium larrymoorei]
MLPETMFAMERLARNNVAERKSGDDHRWETWPSTRLDHFGLFLWRVVQRLHNRDGLQKQRCEPQRLQFKDNPESQAVSAGPKASVID